MAITGTAFLLSKLERCLGTENEIKSSPFIVFNVLARCKSQRWNILFTYSCEISVSWLLALTRCGCESTSRTASSIHARARILTSAAKLGDSIGLIYCNSAMIGSIVWIAIQVKLRKRSGFWERQGWLGCSEFEISPNRKYNVNKVLLFLKHFVCNNLPVVYNVPLHCADHLQSWSAIEHRPGARYTTWCAEHIIELLERKYSVKLMARRSPIIMKYGCVPKFVLEQCHAVFSMNHCCYGSARTW